VNATPITGFREVRRLIAQLRDDAMHSGEPLTTMLAAMLVAVEHHDRHKPVPSGTRRNSKEITQ
jgi:hypothetical protein